jgi:prepilin-type processing-associated H-X9-DG protein
MAIEENNFWDNRGGTLYQASGSISANIDTFPRFYDPDFGDFRYECGSPCLPDIGKLVFFPECVTADTLNMVALSLFQNPVATAAAHFIVNTDVPLKGYPVGYVTIGGNAPSPVYFSPIASKTFEGSFVFTASGSAEVSVLVSSLLERDTVVVNTLSVQLIGAGKTGKLVSADGKVGVLFADGSVKEEIYATCISVSKDSRYDFEDDPEMEAFGEPYQLGPSISFDKYPTISFSLGHYDLEGKDKTVFSIYRYEDGEWNRLESYPDGDRVCAKAKTLGVFRLIYDPNAKPLTNIPQTYQLFQNYPNPFNPETQIKYDLPVSGNVTLFIYNVLGQRVRVLADGFQEAGHKSVIWDGKDNQGREAASGIYFYKIKAENYQKTKKMVLLK